MERETRLELATPLLASLRDFFSLSGFKVELLYHQSSPTSMPDFLGISNEPSCEALVLFLPSAKPVPNGITKPSDENYVQT